MNVDTPLQVGELVVITWSDFPSPGLPEFRDQVRPDGTLILPLSITVQAAGKTPNQLEQDIHDAYVPRFSKMRKITVNRLPSSALSRP